MAPPKSRVHEDSRTETLPARERNGATHAGNASRSRRAANQQASGNATNSRTNAVSGHGGANANIANGEGAATLSEGSKVRIFLILHYIHYELGRILIRAIIDFLDIGRSQPSSGLSQRIPRQQPICIQDAAQSRNTGQFDDWTTVSYNGTAKDKTKSKQGTACAYNQKEL